MATRIFLAVTAVSDDVPLGEVVFFRSFYPLIPLLIFQLPLSTSDLSAAPLVLAGAALAAAQGGQKRQRSEEAS